MKFNNQLNTAVKATLNTGGVPMLLGQPGIGKSSYMEALGKEMGTRTFTLAVNELADKADLTGARLVPDKTVTDPVTGEQTQQYKQVFYPHATIMEAVNYAREHEDQNPILFLDEINRTTADVTSECLSMPTRRAIGSMAFPKNLRIAIAGNDKGNVIALDSASISRFVIFRVAPDTRTFLKLHEDLHPSVKETLTAHPETIFGTELPTQTYSTDDDDTDVYATAEDLFDDGESMSQLATPRTIYKLSCWLNEFTNQDLIEMMGDSSGNAEQGGNLLEEIIIGYTGNTMFTHQLIPILTNYLHDQDNDDTDNAYSPPRPPLYERMSEATNVTDIENMAKDAPSDDLLRVLVYSLFNSDNNKAVITATMSAIEFREEDGSNDFYSSIISLGQKDRLNKANLNHAMAQRTKIAQRLQSFNVIF